jgi:hypothetical protein
MSVQPTTSDPAISDGTVSDTCASCPLLKASEIAANAGPEAEAHFLRVQAVELSHKLALTRAKLRSMGVDPDIAYHPHEQDRG